MRAGGVGSRPYCSADLDWRIQPGKQRTPATRSCYFCRDSRNVLCVVLCVLFIADPKIVRPERASSEPDRPRLRPSRGSR